MSKIIRLEAENVKRLRAVDITPDPARGVVIIAGQNGQGKTSVLDSIAMAFGGGDEIPAMPVRAGAEKARIVVELEDLVVRRTFTAAGGTALVVENKEGARYQSPQAMLDKLTGKLMFDPLAFIKLEPKKRGEALRRLVGLDFTAIDAERKKLYDERTLVNREVDRQRAGLSMLEHYPDAPATEINPAEVVAELEAAQKHNAKLEGLRNTADEDAEELKDLNTQADKLAKEIAELEARLFNLKAAHADMVNSRIPKAANLRDASAKAVVEFKLIDEAPIRQRLADVAGINRQVQANAVRAKAEAALKEREEKSAALTRAIEACDDGKKKALAAAKFPVEGLSFDDSGVLFNGVPFEQASGAEQLRVSVAMAAALNPKLKVMIVRDGSLLDDNSMALLAELAATYGLQVFVERVGGDDPASIIIEDGAVKPTAPEDNTAELPLA